MTIVAIDSNTGLAATLKNKPDKEQHLAYLALLKRLEQAGVEVKNTRIGQQVLKQNEETCKIRVHVKASTPRMPQKKPSGNRNQAFQKPFPIHHVRHRQVLPDAPPGQTVSTLR